MTIHTKISFPGKRFLAIGLVLVVTAAGASSSALASSGPGTKRAAADGQDDFDWELGSWRTSVQVLAEPLSDSEDEWLQFDGTSVVRPLMDGRANVVELRISGPAGQINGLNLRLYEPAAQRWSSTFANLRDGMLTPSVFGAFTDGVGEFYGDDQLDGRPIKVRFTVERQGLSRARFEQAFSDDDGATWETNWIAIDRRINQGH